MKAFVQKVIEDYPRYLQEEATLNVIWKRGKTAICGTR